jgi:transcriptional regulator with XRE-family HTH domain
MATGKEKPLSARRVFAANMKRMRLSKSLSQEKLAALAGLHPNYVGSVERAERNISIDNVEKIAAALDVSVSMMLTAPRARGR